MLWMIMRVAAEGAMLVPLDLFEVYSMARRYSVGLRGSNVLVHI